MNADSDSPPPPSNTLRLDPRRGTIWMLVSLACFTTNALLLKHFASEHINPWVSMSFRFGIGLVVTWLLFAPRLGRSFTSWLLASRGVLGGFGTAAYYVSVGPLGVGKATLIGNTWTVFSALMAVIILKERLSANRLGGLVLAIIGISFLTGLSAGHLGTDATWELVSLGGALLAALVVVVIRQLTGTENSATIFASQCVYGLIIATPMALLHLPHLTWSSSGLLVFAALCASAGQLAMTEGFRFLTVAAGGAFQVMVPLAISLGGVLFFGEHFDAPQLLGAMLIIGGSYLAVRK